MALTELNGADKNLIRSVLGGGELEKRVPRLNEFYASVSDLRDIIAMDASSHGKHVRQSGFTAGDGMYQRVARIPTSIITFIKMYDPDFFRDKRKLYWLLKEFPHFDLRKQLT